MGMEQEAGAAPLRRCSHEPPWPAFALAWCHRPEPRCRLAIGSVLGSEANRVEVVELSEDGKGFNQVTQAEHSFPATKLMWGPTSSCWDVLASTSTTLNLFKLEEDRQLRMHGKLANWRKLDETETREGLQGGKAKSHSKTAGGKQAPEGSSRLPPLTSFDWSADDPHRIGTASVDTTVAIWNVEKQKIEKQLIAHDKAVYDFTFSQHHLFATCGADGSVRLFDQRHLEHSTIIYEACPTIPLLKVAWNPINHYHIAAVAMDSVGVSVFDIRRPVGALVVLSHLDACVNCAAWAPHSRNHLLCGTQDGQALIWDIVEACASSNTAATPAAAEGDAKRARPPALLAYGSGQELFQVQWPGHMPDKVALSSAQQVEVLQI